MKALSPGSRLRLALCALLVPLLGACQHVPTAATEAAEHTRAPTRAWLLDAAWQIAADVESRAAKEPGIEALRGALTPLGLTEVTWRATLRPPRGLSDDDANTFVAATEVLYTGAGYSAIIASMASYAPAFVSTIAKELRVAELTLTHPGGTLTLPPLLVWIGEEAGPELTWSAPRPPLRDEDDLRPLLTLRSAGSLLRAALHQQRVLEEDPFFGRIARKANLHLWPWVVTFLPTLTTGTIALGPIDYTFAAPPFPALERLEVDLRPALDEADPRLFINAAHADHFTDLLCAHATPTDACLDPDARHQAAALALALEGLNASFHDLDALIDHIIIQGQAAILPGVTSRNSVTAFRRPREFQAALAHFMESPEALQRFVARAEPSRREALLGDAPLPSTWSLSFDARGLDAATTTAVPRRYQATLRIGDHARELLIELPPPAE